MGMVTMASVDRSTAPNATVMALKPENLTKASTLETYKAQFQALRTDPRVKHRLKEYYDLCGKYCKPLKVEHAVGALSLLLVVLMYLFGFTKTVMLVSAVIMIFCILVEDVIRTRKPWREVLRNFPSRSKFVIERQFPFLRGKLTEPIAAGIVGVLLAFTVQAVFFTRSSSKAASSSLPPSTASRMPMLSHRSRMVSKAQHKEQLEALYHLGFQDSLDGKPRGHSLADKLDELWNSETTSYLEEDDHLDPIPEIPYSSTPLTRPPPPKTFASRLFSMRTVGSIFYLYRMAMQIGIDPSTGMFSVGQLAANLQHNLPTWQKGMLAFSVYNLFSNLFL